MLAKQGSAIHEYRS